MTVTSSTDPLPPILREAIAASQRDDSDRAIALLQEAMTQFPQSALPHFLLAAEHAQQGRKADAETAFSNALILQPTLHIARFQLGLLQFSSGRPAPAMLTWQPLLDLPDGDALKLFVQGFGHLAQDGFAEALTCFTAGMQANRDNPPLNTDIDRIVTEIRRLMTSGNTSESRAAPLPPTGEVADLQPDHHILVTSYKQSGTLH